MRIPSIEILRIAAILGVICLHTNPFGHHRFEGNFALQGFYHLLMQVSRFAVPFFFVASGYFFGKSIKKGKSPGGLFLSYAKRLVPIFLIWSAIFAFMPESWGVIYKRPYSYVGASLKNIYGWVIGDPFAFLMNGIGIHLWFLPALVIGLAILAIFIKLKIERYLIPFAVLLYAFGLAAGSYAAVPYGIYTGFNTRNGPFFSALFLAIGFYLSKNEKTPSFKTALGITVLGLALQSAEAFYLWDSFGFKMNWNNFLIGTVPLGAGAFLMALSKPLFGENIKIKALGRHTLGVYLAHPLVISLSYPFLNKILNAYLFQVLFPVSVYLLSALITIILLKNRFTKGLVE